jgi:hypothetical protein
MAWNVVRQWALLTLSLLALAAPLVTACTSAGTQTSGAPAAPPPAGAVTTGQTLGTIPSVPAGWKRPMDVAPGPEQGKFKIISQEPAPGDKVRVFFLGAQF